MGPGEHSSMDTISDSQWLVISFLLLMLIGELILHPAVAAGLTSFLGAFKPAAPAKVASK